MCMCWLWCQQSRRLGRVIGFVHLVAIYVCLKTHLPAKNLKNLHNKTQLLLHSQVDSAHIQPCRGWLWCCWGVKLGGPITLGHPVTIWPCLTPPPKRWIFLLFFVTTNGATFPSHSQFSPKQATRWLIVVCLIFSTGWNDPIQPAHHDLARGNYHPPSPTLWGGGW